MNDGGEFGKNFLEIYATELELKAEHDGTHSTFLDLDISIDKGKLFFKMFDKRGNFMLHIARMPSITSNILSIIFYSSRSSNLLYKDFLSMAKSLLDRMINQGVSKYMLLKQIKKAFNRKSKSIHNIKLWIQIL